MNAQIRTVKTAKRYRRAEAPHKLYVSLAASVFDVAAADIRSKSRARTVAYARWAVMVALRAEGRSLCDIARLLGRDHTTVSHGLKGAYGLIVDCPEYAEAVARVVRP